MDEANLALTILRVWVGIVMLAHGVKHLRGREKTTRWLADIGYRQPALQWMAMSATEIGAGILLILGLLTTPALAGTAAIMVVAFLTVHRRQGFWVTARPDEGWEYVATILAASLALALLGPGDWSVDEGLGLADDLDGYVGLGLVLAGAASGVGQVVTFFKPDG